MAPSFPATSEVALSPIPKPADDGTAARASRRQGLCGHQLSESWPP